MHRSRVCHFVIDVSNLDEGVSFWSEALAAVNEPLPEASSQVYRHLRLPDSDIRILLQKTTERARTLWGGTSGGITGVHEWDFTATPTGVHVTTDESFAGEPVEADVTGMQSALDTSLTAWLLRRQPKPKAEQPDR
jgi:hypothetical protein